MADTYPYREALQYVADRCTELFAVETLRLGEPLEDPAAALQADGLTLAQADPELVAFSRACNGFSLEWEATEAQQKLGLESSSGFTDLVSLDYTYGNWDAEFRVDFWAASEDAGSRELAGHLRRFHPVDMFAEFAGILLGIYRDEPHNPGLYLYETTELPVPTGVDIRGYVDLLKLSLGYVYWQLLLVELHTYYEGPQTEPFVVQGLNAQYFVNDMTKLNPDFTLEKFVARYAEVRLRR